MHHSFTKQCVTLGSALVFGLACSPLPAQTESKPPQKALIQFDGLMARWKSGDKPAEQSAAVPSAPEQSRALFAAPKETAAAAAPVPGAPAEVAAQPDAAAQAASGPRKALIPPNTIFNRQAAAMQAPATATPLPPTSLVLNHAAVIPVTNLSATGQPVGSPISTSVPTSLIAQAQLLAGPVPPGSNQPPVIIVMQTTSPDIVNFAPRAISPEVPNDFWPADSRNPLGRRDDHGLFTWPKFAKAIASETMGSPNQPPAGVPNAETPSNNATKALFAPSETAAPVQQEAKALFGRPEPQQPVVAPAQPQQAKALFAKSQPIAAPVAAPSEAAAQVSKSRALFAFGRNREPLPAAPAPVLAPQLATINAMPAPSELPMPEAPAVVDAIDTPPQAPTLSEVKTAPPLEKSSGLKWRAKGSPRGALAESDVPTTKVNPVAPAAAANEVVEQVVPASAPAAVPTPAPSAVPAKSAPPVVAPQVDQLQQAQPQLAQPTKGKALLSAGFFGRKSSQPAAIAPSTAVSQVAVPPIAPPAPPKRANEKALVPGLMAMVTRAKDLAAETEATAPAVEPPACEISATHVAPAVDMASRQSYYAPAVEYVADTSSARRQQKQVPVEASHRKTAGTPTSDAVEEEDSEEPCDEEELCNGHELCDGDEPDDGEEGAEQAVEEPTPPIRRKPPAAQAHAAKPVKRKDYRRLTLRDLTAGFLRPLSVVNEMTKLPIPEREVSEVEEPADNLIAEYEPSVVAPSVHATRVARRRPPVEDTMVATADDEPGTDTPVEVAVEKPLRRGPAVKPQVRQIRTADGDVDLDTVVDSGDEPALASDDQGHDDLERATAPQRIRSGRRQVTVPVVSLEEVGDESTKDLPAMQIRNRRGASVLIYSGSDVTGVEQAGAESTGRQNPLR